jgi:hypothetical protein
MKPTPHACKAIESLVMSDAYGQALSAADRQKTDKHLGTCADCRETVGFLRASIKTVRTHPQPPGPGEPHPDPALIVALEADTLDAPASEHVSAHIVHCDSCRAEYLTLLKWSNERVAERALAGDPELEAEIADGIRENRIRPGTKIADAAKSVQQYWAEMLKKAKRWTLDLGEQYKKGTMLGQIRILSQQMAAPVGRGGTRHKRVAKVLEVPIGRNTYSVELSLMPDEGLLAVDIAGMKMIEATRLFAALRLETGERVSTARTNPHGNAHFTVSRQAIGDIGVLDLHGEGAEAQIAFRLPQHP